MNNDDLRRGSDDESRTRPSDTPNADPQVNVPEFPEFGELPGFTSLPDLAPLPELAPLPDFGDFLNDTPPVIPDEAVAGPADSENSPSTDLFPGVAPLPELTPLPAITDLLPDAASSPGDEAAQAEGGNNWPQVEDIPTTASLPLPDAFPEVEAAPTPTETVAAAAATASSRRAPDGGQKSTISLSTALELSRTRVDKTAIKRKPSVVMIVLGCILALNVAVSLFSPGRSGSSSTPSSHQTTSSTSTATNTEEREHAANLPARAPGYRGSATNTHSISPQWSSGVATAWTLPIPEQHSTLPPQVYVDGSTVYLVGPGSPEGEASQAVTVTAYDVSGEQPALLWSSTGPSASGVSSPYTPAFVSSEDSVFFHDVIIDKTTGEQTPAPWGTAVPLAYADGILVTCTPPSTCNGWTHASGEWTTLWTTPTGQLSSSGLVQYFLDYVPSQFALSGSGEHASVLVPTRSSQIPQIIHIHTGELTELSSPGNDSKSHSVEVASDGYLVFESVKSHGSLFDSDGTLQSTFSAPRMLLLPTVSDDGTYPSISDLKNYMTEGEAKWSSGTVKLDRDNDCKLVATLSGGGSTRKTHLPEELRRYATEYCVMKPQQLRVSADGSALYIDAFTREQKSKYFIDIANGLTYTSSDVNAANQLTWVFDDMLIGMTESGLKAFVPASS